MPAGFPKQGLLFAMEAAMRRCVLKEGCTRILTGMAMGADLWAAQIAMDLKRQLPQITLHGYLPHRQQARLWPQHWQRLYDDMLRRCDSLTLFSETYTRGCMQARNRAMVQDASVLVAVHDGLSAGGTAQTIRMAHRRGLPLVLIDPATLAQTHIPPGAPLPGAFTGAGAL